MPNETCNTTKPEIYEPCAFAVPKEQEEVRYQTRHEAACQEPEPAQLPISAPKLTKATAPFSIHSPPDFHGFGVPPIRKTSATEIRHSHEARLPGHHDTYDKCTRGNSVPADNVYTLS